MKLDRKGLSLVELLVVIAIMAVVGAVGIMSINAMTGRPAQQCAQKIVYSLERHRASAMGKEGASYVLKVVSGTGKIACEESFTSKGATTTTVSELGASGITITYELNDGTVKTLDDTNSLTLAFDRSSGAFKPQTPGGSDYCTKITVKRGGRDFVITLVPLTGKVYID
ncbi:MAG: type II secretion system GspH family protein [Clostridium sp.]|nr:type II secretion system GspH family protein [Acetatifactor muris]MCM1526027.1 type II secretion system GspH family protein [Bacteroides sp.]MCM1562213.1 type II secretion system GspH family protein [Clostridium sp.]